MMDAVRAFAAKGGLVLGVCNGFQILCESGLLPGVLMRNAQLKFVCRDVHLKVERSDTPFTRGYNAGQVIRVPVAHGEGNYEAPMRRRVKRLEGEGRVLFRYCAAGRRGSIRRLQLQRRDRMRSPGSSARAATSLGMMPHPENHVEEYHWLHRRPRPVRRPRGPVSPGGVNAAI
jgi:phosphoribosylformylglycinamidine (FGAM) synthase-like amidotransferase family enzyme